MLIRKPQVHIFAKEVTLATGELVRAFFAVIETEGVPEIRFLGTKPIEENVAPSAEPLLLDTPKRSVYTELFIPTFIEAVSPYFNLDFLVNQLARAPNAR
ncbi:MAG TPA: hypothetical protein VFT82_02560 [Candidatus Paceibacterota bacterium]|nr:hypothetical protein [Candidatus Paceibacterota bacterium]